MSQNINNSGFGINKVVVVGPTRATCQNILALFMGEYGNIPETLLMKEKGKEIFAAAEKIETGESLGFGIIAGTGTGKTVSLREMALYLLRRDVGIDIVTRENMETPQTWEADVIVCTPGIALNWIKNGRLDNGVLMAIDEIHQTSETLELVETLIRHKTIPVIWMSATIDPSVYQKLFCQETVIKCEVFDESRRAKVFHSSYQTTSSYVSSLLPRIKEEYRKVAVFVPTREDCEKYSRQFNGNGLYSTYYHGGESAQKLAPFLKGEVKAPFVVFMTSAGASSLNILGLDTVIIEDSIWREMPISGVMTLRKTLMPTNDILQMAGRVNGRKVGGEVHFVTSRTIDLHSLKPVQPDFVLAGDLRHVVLVAARLGVDITELETPAPLDHAKIAQVVKRFRSRGIMKLESFDLTDYGKKVERLPVTDDWAELLVEAEQQDNFDLVLLLSVCSTIGSLRNITRHSVGSPWLVSQSDHLTGANIVFQALNKFGFIEREEMVYKFRGDFFKSYVDKDTNLSVERRGEFSEWCHVNGFSGKAIKEAGLAIRSILKSLNYEMPDPRFFSLVSEVLKKSFCEIIAAIGSMDIVYNGRGSAFMGEIWNAQHSSAKGDLIVGKVSYFEDKKRITRAVVEGTTLPNELYLKYAKKTFTRFYNLTETEVRFEFSCDFHGQKLEDAVFAAQPEEIPEQFYDSVQKALAERLSSSNSLFLDINAQNKLEVERAEKLFARSLGAVSGVTKIDVESFYKGILSQFGILSFAQLQEKIEKSVIDINLFALPVDKIITQEAETSIYAMSPQSIDIAGEQVVVTYKQHYGDFSAKISLDVMVVEKLTENICLPSGKAVVVVCSVEGYSYESSDIKNLKSQLLKKQLEISWIKARREHEHTSWISNPTDVHPFLPKLLSEIEVAKDKSGESVLAFVSLYSDSDPDFQIRLRESKEEAEKETAVGLRRLFQKSLKSIIVIPDEEPYKTYVSGWSSRWDLTEFGQALKNRIDSIISAVELTHENFLTKLEEVKNQIEIVKIEVSENFVTCKDLLNSSKNSLELRIESLGSIEQAQVRIELDILTQIIENAKVALNRLAYQEVICYMAEFNLFFKPINSLIDARMVSYKLAQSAIRDVESNLHSIYCSEGEFREASHEAQGKASDTLSEINNAFDNYNYDRVHELVILAEVFIQAVRSEIKSKAEFLVQLSSHVQKYTTMWFLNVNNGVVAVDEWYYMDRSDACFAAVAEAIENSGDRFVVLLESRYRGDVVCSLGAYSSSRNTLELIIRASERAHMLNIDWNKVSINPVWQPPSSEKMEIMSKLQDLEYRYDKFLAEYNRLQDSGARIQLSFQLDSSRGTLFCIQTVEGFYVNDSANGNYVNFTGGVRFVCDPKRSSAAPQNGESWICTWGKMIGRDSKGRPIVIANPQARVEDFSSLQAEIARLKAEFNGNNSNVIDQVGVPATSSFKHAGKKDFKCQSCGAFAKMQGGDWEKYNKGEFVRLTCPGQDYDTGQPCGNIGVVKKIN